MAWRLPDSEIRQLFAEGGRALRVLGQTPVPEKAAHEAIERLERILDRLTAADDWPKRLKCCLGQLRNDRARRAFDALVRRGCVPDTLAYCIRCQTDRGEQEVVEEAWREALIYRPRLRDLARSFERVAKECEDYAGLWEKHLGTKFTLDLNLSAFLREETATIREFLRDWKRRRGRTRVESVLWLAMQEISLTTGSFQDRLVADLLNGATTVTTTADNLKRWRARETSGGTGGSLLILHAGILGFDSRRCPESRCPPACH
jgi:hypothetical protein